MNVLARRFGLILLLSLLFAQLPNAQGAYDRPVELERIVAVVNDDVILKSELDAFVRNITEQLRARNTQLPDQRVLERQALERLIVNRVQLQLADRIGIRIDDETLNQAIRNIAAGNRMDLEQFRQTLESQGVSFAAFREDIRGEIIVTQLQQREVDNRVQVSEQEIDNLLAQQQKLGQDDKLYNLKHILIALPDAAAPERIQAAAEKAQAIRDGLRKGADFAETAIAVSDGQQALDGGNLGWFNAGQIPSLFLEAILGMDIGDISDVIRSPSGFHIVQLADVKGDEKHIIQQTKARHILIRQSEIVSDEDARTRLLQLRERIVGGDDFAALARSHSEDPISARNGGDLGWVSPGETVPGFEQAMNRLDPGDISAPVKSRFGWHLIQVLDRRQHDDTAEFRRSKARQFLHARKRQEALELWLRRLRDEAYVEYRLESDA